MLRIQTEKKDQKPQVRECQSVLEEQAIIKAIGLVQGREEFQKGKAGT
jgi:hypothetical protein